MKSIRYWLEKIGLERHADVFEAQEIELETLSELTDDDLKEMGLPIGPRRKVLKAIRKLGPEPGEIVQDDGPPEAPPSHSLEAERRQITVMFCDLVGSTSLSEKLDPEDLRSVMQAYQQAAGAVIEGYEGHVAQYLGDGLMTYFGWPTAHEDDAERAVRTALEIVKAVKAAEGAPEPLSVRIGIATGTVVVGETGGGDASVPKLAVGETPNRAARLQRLASADEVIIGPTTRRLVGGVFDLTDLGTRAIKGIAEPINVSRVEGIARTEDRFEARGRRLTPFVGRDPEISMLLDRWAIAQDGEGQVVLLEGEPGIGKSRLLRELSDRIEAEPHAELRYQCSPYHTTSALFPVIEQLERAAGFAPTDTPETRLDKLEALLPYSAHTRALFAALLSIENRRYPPLDLTPPKQKELMLRALAERLEALSQETPVLLLFEDAHWIDPTTQAALDLQLSTLARLRVLAVVTYRPEYSAPWSKLSHASGLRLARMGKRHTKTMVEIVGSDLPDDLCAEIVARTDGVPLFVEELTNAVRDGGGQEPPNGCVDADLQASPMAIPSTLQDSLTARLDQLGPAKELAQIAACIGRHFSRALLSAVKQVPDLELDNALSALVDSGLVYPETTGDGSSFTFKHVLIQQAAYTSLLNSTRRKIHGDIAAALIVRHEQNQFPDPIVIAQHLDASDETRRALPWLRQAAERAASSGSLQESEEILDRALDLAGKLDGPDMERERAELDLLTAKLPISIAIKGFASDDVNLTCSRSLDLAVSVGDKTKESWVLYQIATMHEVRGEYSKTQAVLARRQRILSDPPEPELAVESGELMACSTFYQGRFETSIEHAAQALHYADPEKPSVLGGTVSEEPTIACLSWIAKSLLMQGQFVQAEARINEAFECARRSPHWYAKSHFEMEATLLAAYRRDYEAVVSHAERAIESSVCVGLVYREAVATLVREWAWAEANDCRPNLEELHHGLSVCRELGAMIGYEFYLALVAEAQARAGDLDRAEALILEALRTCQRGHGFFYESELHRLSAELKLKRSGARASADAETGFRRAIDIAAAKGARLLELRAVNSLARLQVDCGETQKARELLTLTYESFTEGFGSYDLKNAKALLEALK